MIKNIAFTLLASFVLLAVSCGEEKKETKKGNAQYITMEVSLSDRTLSTGYPAAISGVQTVEIRPQVSGMITEILIEEGETVSKGQILFVIDQTPYKAAHEIAEANVKSAEAGLATAQLIYDSNKNLFEQKVVSEFDLMTAQNDLTDAQARLALCKAEEANARNNLSYTEVRSPVNGVASMIPYRVGALVNSSISQPLVTVSDDSQVYAYFSMAENQMLDMVQQYGSLNNAIRQMPKVDLILSNGQKYEFQGKINAISGTISESTGSVSIRAVFNNSNHLLRNGGSGTIIIPITMKGCMVIPQSATYELQDRIFVYKVINDIATSTEITIAPQNNGVEYIVTSGLEVGDVIVAEGAGLIKEGAKIQTRKAENDTLNIVEGNK